MSETVMTRPAPAARHLRGVFLGIGAAAFMVFLGGLAWACLPYHGEVSVYPVNPGGQAVNQFAHGERSVTIHGGAGQIVDGQRRGGMRWCTGDGDEAEPYAAGAIRPSSHSPDLMVVVENRWSGCVDEGGPEDLPMGEYTVAINHAVYGAHANPMFDKNAISEANGDRSGSCYANSTADPANYDYLHPEPIVIGPDGGSLLIDNINMGPSSEARPFANVAGLCLRSDFHNRGPIVPIEILGDRPGNPGGGKGRANR